MAICRKGHSYEPGTGCPACRRVAVEQWKRNNREKWLGYLRRSNERNREKYRKEKQRRREILERESYAWEAAKNRFRARWLKEKRTLLGMNEAIEAYKPEWLASLDDFDRDLQDYIRARIEAGMPKMTWTEREDFRKGWLLENDLELDDRD